MLIYNIAERGKISIYEFLYKCIKDDIVNGKLIAGEKLPSKREMASDNGVALITVESAYEQLVIEGYIEAKERKGYFVLDILNNNTVKAARENPINVTSNLYKNKKEDELIADFTSAMVQADIFPYSVWAKLMRNILSGNEKIFSMAPPSEGIYELRNAISRYLSHAKGLDVSPDQIIVGPGTEYLHSVLLQLIGRSRLVAVEDPGYKKAERIYESNGIKVMHIPVDEEGVDVDKLENSNISLLHVSPAHHFPTGHVMTAKRRLKLLNWANESAAYIIEDDYDSEFRFRGRPMPTLLSQDSSHVIYMNTFSGSLAPSIRMAYMVLPKELIEKYHKKLGYVSGTVSTFEQLTLAAFIDGGQYERHINRVRNKYKKIRTAFLNALSESKLNPYIEIEDDEAGLQLILRISGIANDEIYVSSLLQKGIKLRAMSEYCYNTSKEYAHRFVLRYIDMSEDELKAIFDLCIPTVNM